MKYTFLLFFVSVLLHAQSDLQFDKKFVESENKWVVYQTEKASYQFGYVYIDRMAGMTYHSEGSFIIDGKGEFIPTKNPDYTMMIVRVEPKNGPIAWLPQTRFKELGIKENPDWYEIYKVDMSNAVNLVKWGNFYNSWDSSTKALTYLEKAHAIDPKTKGLAFELGFAYNALQQYEKAIPILSKGLKEDKKDCQLYKELAFAEMNSNRLKLAIETYRKCCLNCNQDNVKGEIAYNLSFFYFSLKDVNNLKYYANEARKFNPSTSLYYKNVGLMEAELSKSN